MKAYASSHTILLLSSRASKLTKGWQEGFLSSQFWCKRPIVRFCQDKRCWHYPLGKDSLSVQVPPHKHLPQIWPNDMPLASHQDALLSLARGKIASQTDLRPRLETSLDVAVSINPISPCLLQVDGWQEIRMFENLIKTSDATTDWLEEQQKC